MEVVRCIGKFSINVLITDPSRYEAAAKPIQGTISSRVSVWNALTTEEILITLLGSISSTTVKETAPGTTFATIVYIPVLEPPLEFCNEETDMIVR